MAEFTRLGNQMRPRAAGLHRRFPQWLGGGKPLDCVAAFNRLRMKSNFCVTAGDAEYKMAQTGNLS
jgi:hypothetical protein